MSDEYILKKPTTEIYVAVCKECKKPFSSGVKSKAISKVTDHYRDTHK